MGNLLKEKIKSFRYKLPLKFRFIYDFPFWIYSRFQIFQSVIYPQVFVAESLKPEKDKMYFAYIGALETQRQYWFQKVLSEHFREYFLGRHFFWKVPHVLEKNNYDCSLVICGSDIIRRHFSSSSSDYFYLPYWLEMEIDFSFPYDQLLKRRKETYKSILRKIKKNNLSFEISKDENRFKDFYHNMYVPYVKSRYGETALIESYDFARDVFSRSQIVFIKQNNIPIAGHLVEYKDKKVFFHLIGLKNGNADYIKLGVTGAMDYFSIIEIQNKGYTKINFGGCRPFLNDGVTRYKISFAAKIIPQDKVMKDYFSLIFLKNTSALKNFLKENPFIFFKEKKMFCRALFLESGQFTSQKEFFKYLDHHNCNGLQHTYLFLIHEDEHLSSWLKSLDKTHFTIKPADTFFPVNKKTN